MNLNHDFCHWHQKRVETCSKSNDQYSVLKYDRTMIQKIIFLTNLKGQTNLFVTGKFLYSQYRNKEENTEGTEDLFLYGQIFVKSMFVRTIFDCIIFTMLL